MKSYPMEVLLRAAHDGGGYTLSELADCRSELAALKQAEPEAPAQGGGAVPGLPSLSRLRPPRTGGLYLLITNSPRQRARGAP